MFSVNNPQVLSGVVVSALNQLPNIFSRTQTAVSFVDRKSSSNVEADSFSINEKEVLQKVLLDMGFEKKDIHRNLKVLRPLLNPEILSHSSLMQVQSLFSSIDHRLLDTVNSPQFQIQHRGFKSARATKFTGFGRTLSDKNANQPGDNYSLKDMMKPHMASPEIQRNLIEAYRRGLQESLNLFKKEENKDKYPGWTTVKKVLGVLGIMGAFYVGFFLYRSIQDPSKSGFVLNSEKWDIPNEVTIRFDDVLGCDEVKKELEDVVEFLRNPARFTRVGAQLPHGVLLVGSPGVGKTLLARAVAGEAGVPFMHVSGSEFDEMFVGTGAARVRRLFHSAKAKAPCVVFIDELDTVGGKRTSSSLHPYANQTINQLLAEMDGFQPSDGVIVLGATNRRENLDPAILRPGRFDVEVKVSSPDQDGRIALFSLYLNKVKLGCEVDFKQLAQKTTGLTGADIKNIVNQAAIAACLDGSNAVNMEHLWMAFDKIKMGPARKRLSNEDTNAVTACHEAGHALIAFFDSKDVLLHKVTIISRGQSLGHTSFISDKEMHNATREDLLSMLDRSMGGRVAEEIVYGVDRVTTGASSDFKMATDIAVRMVTEFGMSDKLGPRIYRLEDNAESISSATKDLIDAEVSRLLNESYERARKLLLQHSKELQALSDALLKYETLDREDVEAILSGGKPKIAEAKTQPASDTESGGNSGKKGFLGIAFQSKNK